MSRAGAASAAPAPTGQVTEARNDAASAIVAAVRSIGISSLIRCTFGATRKGSPPPGVRT
jgi:hypothetical protein